MTYKHEKAFEERLDNLGCNGPRVTVDHIDSIIQSIDYHKVGETTMICYLVVKNGFSFVGKAACASVENYREEIAKELSLKDAKDQIWKMEAYLIKQREYDIKPDSSSGSQIPPYQKRVIDEKAEVSDRLDKLLKFFDTPLFASLPEPDRALLKAQATHMKHYEDVLAARIDRFEI